MQEPGQRRHTPWGLAIFWIAAGANHFVNPGFYEPMIPPPLNRVAGTVNKLAGNAEIAAGLAVLSPRTRRAAGPAIVALLAAVFPANIYMALRPERFHRIPRWALMARLPLQGVMAVWGWRATRS